MSSASGFDSIKTRKSLQRRSLRASLWYWSSKSSLGCHSCYKRQMRYCTRWYSKWKIVAGMLAIWAVAHCSWAESMNRRRAAVFQIVLVIGLRKWSPTDCLLHKTVETVLESYYTSVEEAFYVLVWINEKLIYISDATIKSSRSVWFSFTYLLYLL